jgi:hypothetical protein
MMRCEGCGADLEQQQDHDVGCSGGRPKDHENDLDECRSMARRYGSKFAHCPCGRERVLMYQRGEEGTGIARGLLIGTNNGPGSNRLTYHGTPEGFACTHGGALLCDVDGAAEVKL